ncbi:MAG: hypothetical protein IJL17_17055 [Kiritimatiellae bacterium]|nr:hypothetical protein [Kiritimatiellia bacterium]
MNHLAEKVLSHTKTGIFTFGDVLTWLPHATRAAVYAHVQRALKSGAVIQVRRGLYHLSRSVFPSLVSTEVLANLIYGPSYVSLETALAYHGWIPEAVRNCTSVTSGRPKHFDTPHGRFSYLRIKQTPLMAGVLCASSSNGNFLVATPLKALADIVAARGLDWTGVQPLVSSLRIEPEDIDGISSEDFEMLDGVYYSKRARVFLSSLRKELNR